MYYAYKDALNKYEYYYSVKYIISLCVYTVKLTTIFFFLAWHKMVYIYKERKSKCVNQELVN